VSVATISRARIDRDLIKHIESRTIRPTTAYGYVARAIALFAGTGVEPTFRDVMKESKDLAQRANIGGITFDDFCAAWPRVIAALESPDPVNALQI